MSLAHRLFKEQFEPELIEAIDTSGSTPERWSVAGKGKRKGNPDGENGAWWRANGPDMVQRWIDWRKREGWKVWTTPSGEPAIELDMQVDVSTGEESFDIKAFIDRVMIEPATKGLVIVDLKTGARTPESDLQLGVYRYLLWRKFGVRVDHGAYWMARKGDMEVLDLRRYQPELVELWFKRFRRATEDGVFLPHPTYLCRACPVREYCLAFGGNRAHMDPDHPQWGEQNR
jgi:RecB family exonuclease